MNERLMCVCVCVCVFRPCVTHRKNERIPAFVEPVEESEK